MPPEAGRRNRRTIDGVLVAAAALVAGPRGSGCSVSRRRRRGDRFEAVSDRAGLGAWRSGAPPLLGRDWRWRCVIVVGRPGSETMAVLLRDLLIALDRRGRRRERPRAHRRFGRGCRSRGISSRGGAFPSCVSQGSWRLSPSPAPSWCGPVRMLALLARGNHGGDRERLSSVRACRPKSSEPWRSALPQVRSSAWRVGCRSRRASSRGRVRSALSSLGVAV